MNGTMSINKQGHLEIGGCDVVELAQKYGTPLYIFDEETVINNAKAYLAGLAELENYEVIYASKAFLTLGMCKLIEALGLSIDVVSGGELYVALQAGFPVNRIYFHGNNKSISELQMAIDVGVGRIVVDNFYELETLAEIAANKRRQVNILLRLNPGVEADTHSYIQTGQPDSKFGFSIGNGDAERSVDLADGFEYINLKGIHCHIGSQIFDISSYKVAINVMMDFILNYKSKGITLSELNLGGGLGIRYTKADQPVPIPEFTKFLVSSVKEAAEQRNLEIPRIMIEPGRSIVGEAGTTVYQIGAIKDIPGIRTYASVDGGMTDNPRVALYQAQYHGIVANKADQPAEKTYTVAGKCCESSDKLIENIELPQLEPGDLLAVLSTGAYNYSMASNYNSLPRPAIVTVYRGESKLMVERETYADLIRLHRIPKRWQAGI